jgi:hypothetical protein
MLGSASCDVPALDEEFTALPREEQRHARDEVEQSVGVGLEAARLRRPRGQGPHVGGSDDHVGGAVPSRHSREGDVRFEGEAVNAVAKDRHAEERASS